MSSLATPRLLLRRWRDTDREPFFRLNSDPKVMEYFPACLTREESDQGMDRIVAHFERYGFGLFAAELRESGTLIGFIGLGVPHFEAHFTPCTEIGWRLAADFWGLGLATEGAREVVRHWFHDLHRHDLVSFTVPANLRSRRVMEKLGMTHDPADDFDHPGIPANHALKRHVLYRLFRTPENQR